MFIPFVITYILGIIFYFIFIPKGYDYYLLSFILLSSLFFFKYLRYFQKLKVYFLFIFFLGILVSQLCVMLNETKLLTKEHKFEIIYAEVYKIEKSNYNNKQYLYLKNVIFSSIKYQYQEPKKINLKLTYNKVTEIKQGDIIKALVVVFPPSESVIPFGFNFKENSLFKNISGNGYIVGKIILLKEKDSLKEDSLYYKIKTLLNNYRESFKNNIKNGINNYISKDISPFLIAISLGEYSFLPKDSLNYLRYSSLAHLISISGYHISVISAFLFFFTRWLLSIFPKIVLNYDTKKLAAFVTILALLFYIFIIGDNTPAIRATIMGIAFLITIIAGLQALSFNSLFLAGALILTFEPYNIFSASFLLSFLATFALIYFCNIELIKNLDTKSKSNIINRFIFFIISSVLLTAFIEISIFPLIAYYFQVIPLSGIFSNLLASSIFSFLIMPSLIIYFFTPIVIGKYFLIFSNFGMELVIKIAKFFSNIPHSLIYTEFFSGGFLFTILFLYLTGLLIKNKYSIVFFILYVIVVISYFIKPSPDIIIDSTGSSIAIKNNNTYFFSNKIDNFVKSLWFKNPLISTNNKITKMPNSFCEDYHCIVNIKNKNISIAESNKYFNEDCGNLDVIFITNRVNKEKCSSALIIDQNFLATKGATELYINKNHITVFSVNDSYFYSLLKFFLQYVYLFTILISG